MSKLDLSNQLLHTVAVIGIDKTFELLHEEYSSELRAIPLTQPTPMDKLDLSNQLLHTVAVLGIDKTFELLREAEFGGVPFVNKDVEFVITSIGSQMKLPNHEIVFGIGRKNDRKYAIGFAAHYLLEKYKYTKERVAEILNKDVSTCMKYAYLIKKLDLKRRYEINQNFLEHKLQLDLLFEIEQKEADDKK